MNGQRTGNLSLVIISLLVGLLLNVLPLGFKLAWLRPEWLVLLVIYWVVRFPAEFGIGYAWLLGLLLDGFESSLLGQHALAMAVVTYLTIILQRRLSVLGAWQQAAIMFMLVGVFQLLCHWVQNISGSATPNLLFLVSCLSSALCWPLVRYILDSRVR